MRPGVRGAVVRSVLGTALFVLTFLLLADAPGYAQSPLPLPGFVPPYEITRIARMAGFYPLAPPLREGTTYVIRATDFRGILMRVVVDARSGAIRAVNRIVSDQGMYGAVGMLPSPYGLPAPYSGPPAYATPDFEIPGDIAPDDEASAPAPSGLHPAARPLLFEPPLPRPRPAALAARRTPDDAKAAVKSSAPPAVTVDPALKRPPPVELPD